MSKARNLSDLLDANGDVVSGSLDNVPPADLVNDTTPQLGGNLDLNGSDITGTGNVNVTGTITATNFVGSDLVNDTTPQLGGTLDANSNNIEFGDSSAATNNRLKFGAGPDLQIYHDGSNSYVNDTGTGNLILKGGTQVQLQASNGETALTTNDNGAVSLNYDNSTKLATTSTGVSVTGDLNVSGSIAGAGKVLQIVRTVSNTEGVNGTFRQLSGIDFYYYENTAFGAQITKQSSTSTLIVMAQYSFYSGGNTHDTYIWRGSVTGANSERRHIGYDPYRHTRIAGGNHHTHQAVFTSVPTGTHNFYIASGRGDSSAFTNARINYNPQSHVSADTANENCHSSIVIWEVEV